MHYIVEVPEVHYQSYAIEANSPSEAASLVADGEGDIIEDALEYSHTLDLEFVNDSPSWTVRIDTAFDGGTVDR